MQGGGYAPGMPQQQMPMQGWGRMIPMMPTSVMRRMAIERGPIGMMSAPHVEAWLAFIKSTLAISETQLAQWNAFTEATGASLRTLKENYDQAVQSAQVASANDQADVRIKILSARLEAEKTMTAARRSLYAVLSDLQRKLADELFDERV